MSGDQTPPCRSAPHSTRRVPAQLIEMLRVAVERSARGPSPRVRSYESDAHMAGVNDERARQALWRDSWLTPELAAIAAWADGRITIQDITYQTAAYRTVVEEARERK